MIWRKSGFILPIDLPTLELLKIMLDCDHTDIKTINGLVEYWKYFTDMPANFRADYQRLFADQ